MNREIALAIHQEENGADFVEAEPEVDEREEVFLYVDELYEKMDQEDIVYCPNGKVPTRDYIKDRIKKSHAINKKKVDKYLENNGDMSKFWKPMPWTSGPTMYDSVAKEKGKVDVSSLVQPIIKNANIVPDEKPKDVAKQPSIDFSALPLSPWRRLDYTKDASQLPKPIPLTSWRRVQVPVASKKDGLHHGNAVADLPMDKGPKKDIVPMPKLETVPIVKEIVKEVVKNNDNGNETDCTPKIRIFENNDQPANFSKDNNDVLTKPIPETSEKTMHDPVAKKTEKYVVSSEPVKDAKPEKKDPNAVKLPVENGQLMPKNDNIKMPKFRIVAKPNPYENNNKTAPKEKDKDQSRKRKRGKKRNYDAAAHLVAPVKKDEVAAVIVNGDLNKVKIAPVTILVDCAEQAEEEEMEAVISSDYLNNAEIEPIKKPNPQFVETKTVQIEESQIAANWKCLDYAMLELELALLNQDNEKVFSEIELNRDSRETRESKLAEEAAAVNFLIKELVDCVDQTEATEDVQIEKAEIEAMISYADLEMAIEPATTMDDCADQSVTTNGNLNQEHVIVYIEKVKKIKVKSLCVEEGSVLDHVQKNSKKKMNNLNGSKKTKKSWLRRIGSLFTCCFVDYCSKL